MKKIEIWGSSVSPELKSLIKTNPELTNEDNFPLCDNTEVNFILALLIEHHRTDFINIFTKQLLPPTETIKQPYKIVQPVNFTYGNTKHQLRSGLILTKPAVGSNAGTIITGPYTGLILYMSPLKNNAPAIANRIWNNKTVGEDVVPHVVRILKIKKSENLDKATYLKLSDNMIIFSRTDYRKWTIVNSNLRTLDDQLIYLCNILGIPLQKNI